ncbi:MAG TPA: P-II family nitrogen regulator [Candidatus Limnocylindria bacterium]|nr:P-II family nitrogen regulator [Candidatus Limnocylindria bacterium]
MARRRVLNSMKRLEIVLECAQLTAVRRLLDDHATGYTIVHDVTGYGHHGLREREMILVLTVVTREHFDPIVDALLPMLGDRSGVVMISDVEVLRGEHFVPELRGRKLVHGI